MKNPLIVSGVKAIFHNIQVQYEKCWGDWRKLWQKDGEGVCLSFCGDIIHAIKEYGYLIEIDKLSEVVLSQTSRN